MNAIVCLLVEFEFEKNLSLTSWIQLPKLIETNDRNRKLQQNVIEMATMFRV